MYACPIAIAIRAKGTVDMRAIMSRFESLMTFFMPMMPLVTRTMLWLNTVPSARIAPSDVLIDAATMPIKHHPPRNCGACCVSR